jgi:23S rRNA (pseudouridine1915-N3)-methyltransferase
MKVELAAVTPRKQAKSALIDGILLDYIHRSKRLTEIASALWLTEGDLLAAAERSPGQGGRPAAVLWLFDSRGDLLTSEQFAEGLGRLRDAGTQRLMLAIGPADGWSGAALARADRKLSLGRMTLPHELARVVVAEQVYRAFTILAGHPYHRGH